MSGRNNKEFRDYDMFDDDIYSSSRRSGKANNRPVRKAVPKSKRAKARERRIRQLKNRSLLIVIGAALLILIIILFTIMVRGCGNGGSKVVNVSTDTIAKQLAKAGATPSEAAPQSPEGDGAGTAANPFKTPVISDDGTDGYVYGEVCIWNSSGFQRFSPDSGSAEAYAAAVNGIAQKSPSLKVYSLVAPGSTELCLPERLKSGEFTTESQAEFITSINNSLDSGVTSVNAYDALADRNTEYIYYKSDDNWTDLGAYYAYEAFTKSAGLSPLALTSCEENTIEGFYGNYSLYTAEAATDTVSYRYLPYDAPMDVIDQSGTSYTNPSPYYEAATSGAYTYGVFLVGDNPLSVIRSGSTSAQGSKIAVIKEDYGDALAPYLSYNYSEVHIIDYRYFDLMGIDFSGYCAENGITDVLIINDAKSAGAQNHIDMLNSL